MVGEKSLNFNIGVLGHVDSGKTSLVKLLTSVKSTACFDKCRQSQERGITIDLGFSSFSTDAPDHIEREGFSKVRYTLVDCPGHASLIRTIIGGAQIIDLMLLVVDINKGIQTQTAECIVIGQMLCSRMVVVLNKLDLVDQQKRDGVVAKCSRRILSVLKDTCFNRSPVVAVSARGSDHSQLQSIGIDALISVLQQSLFAPLRDRTAPLLIAVDHCFSIRGHGTVMTGTVLQGTASINQVVELPSVGLSRRLKSIQTFKTSVSDAPAGARVGISVAQFDVKRLERGFVAAPGLLTKAHAVVAQIKKVSYFRDEVKSKCRYHVTLGHETVTAELLLFGDGGEFDAGSLFEYHYHMSTDTTSSCWALLQLDSVVIIPPRCRLIGSRLDMNSPGNSCRLAFHGHVVEVISAADYRTSFLPRLRIYKCKERTGVVERAVNTQELIVRGMFKKESDLQPFQNLHVKLSSGETGHIISGFGKSGKIKVFLPDGLSGETRSVYPELISNKIQTKCKSGSGEEPLRQIQVVLRFKRFIFDESKSITQ